jgi:hypothetical protein
MTNAPSILVEAQALAKASQNWADLSNALFEPFSGLVARRYPDEAKRKAFYDSEACEALYALLERKMRETGVEEGAAPTKSGRFVVRMPRSLHSALELEAAQEGTSLNQLVVTKLAVGLKTVSRRQNRPPARAKRAFGK